MAKDPAFLFYPGDWLGGTMTFSRSQKGAYIDLLMSQFNQGRLSLEDIKDVLGSDFDTMWERKLKSKYKVDEKGFFYNERLDLEQQKRKNFSESRRKNKGHMTDHMTDHMSNHMEDENKDVIENIIRTELETKIEEFYAFRKEMKKPILNASKGQFLNTLTKLSGGQEGIAIEILNQSIANGWQGIFELKQNGNTKGNNNSDQTSLDRLAEQSREVLRRLGDENNQG